MPEQVYTEESYVSSSPYSQGIIHGDTVYVAGQVPVDADGTLVDGGITEQTEKVMENLETVLNEAGTSLDDAVKATVFLTDIDDFDAFNEVYADHMPEPRPARSAIEVADLAIDAKVEVEVIAALE
jgi:2-iminobutanoate/2-iminopropanoate deaminase